MKIKIENTETRVVKTITKPDGFPIEVGDTIRMKWHKEWKVLSIK